jgi:hypothetical protein
LLFIAGVAVAKSKGRGEECISQNLRILRAKNGRRTIVLFANSQRKEKKGYILIPGEFRIRTDRLCRLADECSVDSVDQIHQEKKGGRPVSLTLRPNSELMSQLKTLQIQFLHENREWHLPLAHYSVASALTDSSFTVLRPEEILRDFEPSSWRRRHLRHRTFVSLSDTKIPILNICMHHATYFSAVSAFQSVHAATLQVFGYLTVSIRQLRTNLESDECGPTLLGCHHGP